jgi:tripartite-type tricarboxylate transporter receptor subunit TctC
MTPSLRASAKQSSSAVPYWIALSLALLAMTSALLAALPARAEDVANFYRGKQIRFIVGSAAGGTYDLLARIVARHMGAHIPGEPLIVVQNQPTAGGLAMVN